jgi:hypothetical protein
MPEYRAYTLGPDGLILSSKGFAADDDMAAREQARQLVDGHDVELWAGERLVVRMNTGRSVS